MLMHHNLCNPFPIGNVYVFFYDKQRSVWKCFCRYQEVELLVNEYGYSKFQKLYPDCSFQCIY